MPTGREPELVREQFLARGIDLGDLGAPLAPVVEQFLQRGIVLHPDSVGHMRYGDKSGQAALRMVEAADLLEGGNAELKYAFYGMVLEGLEQVREKQVGVGHQHRWLSEGYTEAAAEVLGIASVQVLRRGIRLMRLDMVVESVFVPSAREAVLPAFRVAAGNFLRDYADPTVNFPSQISSRAAQIAGEWDDGSMEKFYALLHQGSRRSIGAWLPYEIEALGVYYAWQQDRGGPLTAVDGFSLKRLVRDGRAVSKLVRQLARVSQVKPDAGVTALHRSLLLSRWEKA